MIESVESLKPPGRTREAIVQAILQEREAQDREYGGPAHDDRHTAYDWVAQIAKHAGRGVDASKGVFVVAMTRVAALALAAIEWAERKQTGDWR